MIRLIQAALAAAVLLFPAPSVQVHRRLYLQMQQYDDRHCGWSHGDVAEFSELECKSWDDDYPIGSIRYWVSCMHFYTIIQTELMVKGSGTIACVLKIT